MDTKRFLLNGFYAKISFLVIWVFLSSFFITPTVLAQTTDFAGGSGTISNPYQITNCIQLQNVKNHLSSNFILNNDVDCSDTINWNNGAGFEPIGSNLDNAFTGRFNGLSHIIYNLYINRPSTNNVGLFGYVRNQRNYIERVGFSGASILGNYNVGILAGFGNYSSFSQSFSVGSLVKGVSRVGGLIGESYASNIYNSYSVSSSVIGFRPSNIYPGYVGGLVGSHSYGNVVNSYSANYVSNAVYFSYSYVGGLVGYLGTNGQISNSYRNLETSVSMVGGGGIPRNTDEMKQGSTFSGWMIESGSTWGISPSINDGYPYLKSFSLPSSPLNPILSAVGQENKRIILNWRLPFGSNSASYYIYGSDTPDFVPSIDNKIADIVFSSPYEDTVPVTGVLRFYKVVAVNPGGSSVSNEVSALSLMTPISTCAELQDIKNNLSGEYILVNNINCFETANWNQEAGFEPIMNFRGVFD